MANDQNTLTTTCCIAGGGPAGMMLGLLLARAGVPVVVMEKHADFFRDFRGDTIHPSTLTVLGELGLLAGFLKLPHQKVDHLSGQFGDDRLEIANFKWLGGVAPYIAMIPQWDFLAFLADHAKAYPRFRLEMSTAAQSLIVENGRVVGIQATTPAGPLDIRAALTVGADGRHSTVRESAGLVVDDLGAPMDVFWFHLTRLPTDTDESTGRFDRGQIAVMINRNSYWQCGFVIAKGTGEAVRAKGLEAFRASLARALPIARDGRAAELKSWDDINLLTVTVDRLKVWHRPGLLMIGDAAHAMSPVGGIGINLAIQDAVAAANILGQPLLADTVSDADLAAVQSRRLWPTRVTQGIQIAIQRNVIARALNADAPFRAPWLIRAMLATPGLLTLPTRFIGLGVRPEHVRPIASRL